MLRRPTTAEFNRSQAALDAYDSVILLLRGFGSSEHAANVEGRNHFEDSGQAIELALGEVLKLRSSIKVD